VGDKSYEAEVSLEIGEGAEAGITLFYSERMFCGFGFTRTQMLTYNNGVEHAWMRQDMATHRVRVKLINYHNVVTFYYMHEDKSWKKHPWQMEVSGFHHNVFGGFLSLKVGVYCVGAGEATLRNFVYRGGEDMQ
jgi:xylan 1,4-beta-xylosidase